MRITRSLALPIAVSVASLVTGVLVAPPIHLATLRAYSVALAVPVDGGGPVDLSLPWDQPVVPASTPSPSSPLADIAGATVAGTPGAVTAVPALVVPGNASGIPSNVLVAYQNAATAVAVTDPTCRLPWPVIAGIGKVESGHARGGALDSAGRTVSPILGPVLSGGPFAAIPDSDDGRWDGDRVWDRAVGPMQFIPSSWQSHAVDANGDGTADPSNIFDSTLAAAGYLCTGERDLSQTADLRQAVFGYNHSWPYVDTVLAWAQAYGSGGALAIAPVSGNPGTVVLASGPGKGSIGGTSTPSGHRRKHPRPTSVARPTPTTGSTMPPASNLAPSVVDPTETPALPDPSPSGTPTDQPTDQPTPVETGCPSDSPTPTDPASPTGTGTATDSPTPTPTPIDSTATSSPTESPTGTATPTDPCATPTPSPTETASPSPSPTVPVTLSPSPTPTPTS